MQKSIFYLNQLYLNLVSNFAIKKLKINIIECKYKTNKNKSKDQNTKVFEIHLTKSRHTFSRLVHISVRRLSSMHVL